MGAVQSIAEAHALREARKILQASFLPGATVEGGEGLFDLPAGSPVTALPFLADSEATTVAGLREDYNRLLAALRTAGLMAQEAGDP